MIDSPSGAASPQIELGEDPRPFRDPVASLITKWKVTPWRAFLIGVGVFGIGEKILLPLIQGYIQVGGELSEWRPDIEALVNGFLLVPTILAAYVWQIEGVHDVFVQFARKASFDDEQRFRAFMGKAKEWFEKPWWILAVVVAVVGVVLQGLWLWDPQNPKPVAPWWSDGEPIARWVALTLALPGWYAAAQIVFNEVRLAWVLRRLWNDLKDHYRLGSKGRTGGVGSLSRNISILATVGAVVLLNLVLGLLLPQIRDASATPDFFLWALVIWVAYLVFVPGIILSLLWPAHVVMEEKRSSRIEDVVEQIDNRFKDAETAIETPGQGGPEVDELGNLRRLRDWLEADLPSWPLPDPLRAASWSTIVPISLTVLTIVLERVS